MFVDNKVRYKHIGSCDVSLTCDDNGNDDDDDDDDLFDDLIDELWLRQMSSCSSIDIFASLLWQLPAYWLLVGELKLIIFNHVSVGAWTDGLMDG